MSYFPSGNFPQIVQSAPQIEGMPELKGVGLGGFWSGFRDTIIGIGAPNLPQLAGEIGQAQATACVHAATGQPKLVQLQAQIDQIAKEWKPSGYYTVAQVNQIVSVIVPLATNASSMLAGSPKTTEDAVSVIEQFTSKLTARIVESQTYTNAVVITMETGIDVIDSPGLKKWVTNTLNEVASTMTAAFALQCNLSFLDTVGTWLNGIKDFLLAIVNVVVKVGQAIYKIPDTVSTLWTMGKWAVVIGGVAFFYLKVARPWLNERGSQHNTIEVD